MGTAQMAIIGVTGLETEGWAIIALVVGAMLGLVPRYFDERSSNARDKREQDARLRAMLAGVLVKCVQSTNDFLAQAATLRFDREAIAQGTDPEADLLKAKELAFEMKTAWMEALVSFGDPIHGAESSDWRPDVIKNMLREVDETYPDDGVVTTDQVTVQLGKIATIARARLNELIGPRTVS
jgi:hypothetical protein